MDTTSNQLLYLDQQVVNNNNTHTYTNNRLTVLCPGLPWWAGTRKVKPIWILLKQETVHIAPDHDSTPPLSFLQARCPSCHLTNSVKALKAKKAAHTWLPSVGFRSWSRFLAVSLQVTWVINTVVGCHYFPPGPQLPSRPLRGLLPILLLGE